MKFTSELIIISLCLIHISHQITSPLSTYATYVGSKQTGPSEAFPVLLGDMDLQGNTVGTLLDQIGKYRMKFQGQVPLLFTLAQNNF